MNGSSEYFGVLMKTLFAASLSLAVLLLAQPSFAANDPSTDTSDALGNSALVSIAIPVFAVAGTAYAATQLTDNVVKIVGAGGKGLAELTTGALEEVSDSAVSAGTSTLSAIDSSEVKVEINKKKIPLVVRKDYLQLNEKVKGE
jgi:hypothetical protein